VVPLLESRGQILVSPRVAGFRPWPDGRLLLQDVYLKETQ
jgi:hypothetical protein